MSNTGPNYSGNQQRSYNYVDGPADYASIVQAAGLDPSVYATQEFVAERGMPALMELFADGEQRFGEVDPGIDPYAVLASTPEQRHGEFYEEIAQLRADAYAHGGPLEDEMHRLERFAGRYLAGLAARGETLSPQQGRNMIEPGLDATSGEVVVDCAGYQWHADRQPVVILEYGPGMAGTKWFEPLLQGLATRGLPFRYIGVSNGPFVNQYLVDMLGRKLEERFGPGAGQYAATGQLFIPREDGMERATTELLATPQPDGTYEICDLIVLSAVHTADPGELERTIALSPQLLRPSGRLMISAPLTEVMPGSATFAQELAWALQAGYTIEWQGQANTGDAQLGTATVSGFAVLHK